MLLAVQFQLVPYKNIIRVEYPKLGNILATFNSILSMILVLGILSKIVSDLKFDETMIKILLKYQYSHSKSEKFDKY